jgi:uncharacterized protein (DUF433 family)
MWSHRRRAVSAAGAAPLDQALTDPQSSIRLGAGGTALREATMPPESSEVDPEVLSGTPVFRGTRVPAQSLFDYLEAGDSLDVFLAQFPSVRREQVRAVLTEAKAAVLTAARAA